MMYMKYTILGVVFVAVACASTIEIPTPNKLLVCAGLTTVYYDRIRNTNMKDVTHPEMFPFYDLAMSLQTEKTPVDDLHYSEGEYQGRVLNDEQLAAEIDRCERML